MGIQWYSERRIAKLNAMFYLIDGYNLLHQTPLLTRDRNDGWLQRARERLVTFIRTKLASDESSKATIVFDTQRSAPSLGDSIDYGNVQVLFARNHDEADDLLEELIELCRTPSSLCVVSSDRRVQAAGKRFHAREIIDSRAWFEWLDSLPASNNAPGQELQTVEPGGSEMSLASTGAPDVDYWLREFGLIFDAPTPSGSSKSHAQPNDIINLNQMPEINAERIEEHRKAKKPSRKPKQGHNKKTEVPKEVRDRSIQTSPEEIRQRANRALPDVENPFGDDLGDLQ